MPQFDPTYFAAQIFWLVIIFTVLYLVLSRMVLPKIGGVLQERAEKIEGDLAKAERLRNEAERVRASMEESLADARAKARDEMAVASQEAADEAAAALAEAREKSEKEITAALDRIAAARDAAKADIRKIAMELSEDIVTRFGGETSGLESKVDDALGKHSAGDGA